MELQSIDALLEDLLKDTYNAENQLLKALPQMAEAASSNSLQEAFTKHLQETQEQINRLEQVSNILGVSLSGKKCHGMEGLIKEGSEVINTDGEDAVIDAALIAAAQKVEHYEIAAYGTLVALAEQLGLDDVVDLLQETLNEEKATDQLLSEIALDEVNLQAEEGEDLDEGLDLDEEFDDELHGRR